MYYASSHIETVYIEYVSFSCINTLCASMIFTHLHSEQVLKLLRSNFSLLWCILPLTSSLCSSLKHMLSPQKAPERLLQLADSNLGSLVVEMDQLHSRVRAASLFSNAGLGLWLLLLLIYCRFVFAELDSKENQEFRQTSLFTTNPVFSFLNE